MRERIEQEVRQYVLAARALGNLVILCNPDIHEDVVAIQYARTDGWPVIRYLDCRDWTSVIDYFKGLEEGLSTETLHTEEDNLFKELREVIDKALLRKTDLNEKEIGQKMADFLIAYAFELPGGSTGPQFQRDLELMENFCRQKGIRIGTIEKNSAITLPPQPLPTRPMTGGGQNSTSDIERARKQAQKIFANPRLSEDEKREKARVYARNMCRLSEQDAEQIVNEEANALGGTVSLKERIDRYRTVFESVVAADDLTEADREELENQRKHLGLTPQQCAEVEAFWTEKRYRSILDSILAGSDIGESDLKELERCNTVLCLPPERVKAIHKEINL